MLLNCVAYRDGGRMADLAVEQISEHLDIPGGFVWVALRDPTLAELDDMRRQFDLHPLAVEDARRNHTRPKIDEYDDTLLVVMQLIEWQAGEMTAGEVVVFAGPNYVLSVRNGSQQHFLGVRERCEREPQLLKQGAGFVLYALMDAVASRYLPTLELLESELEGIEDRILVKGSTQLNIERLYALKRKVMTLKHAVSPLLQFTGRLYGGRVPAVCAHTQDYFRDVIDDLARIDGSVDVIRDSIATAVTVNLSMATVEESAVTKGLAAWAGIFAVATTLAGIWGMNFEFMPELKQKWGYPAALGLIVSACSLMWWRFRRLRWL